MDSMKNILLASALLFMALAGVYGQTAAAKPAVSALQPGVFDIPELLQKYSMLQAQIAVLVASGRHAEAEQRCREALQIVPFDPNSSYNLACMLALQNKQDEAMEYLEKAVALGFNNTAHMEKDKDLDALRKREDFKKLLKKAAFAKPDPNAGWKYNPEPAEINDGIAMVTEKNTGWDFQFGIFRSFFKFPEFKKDTPIASGYGEAGDLLRRWQSEGTAAGNHGDLYDNHDGDHSNMSYGSFPQLARIEFGDVPKSKRLANGLQLMFIYNAPTIGNASVAVVGSPAWRSMPRLALTEGARAPLLYMQYMSNQMYFYPEHQDHDPGRNGDGGGYGDVLPANTPYYIISQGSSGSDRVFMDAVCATMAAFRPEVKAELVAKGWLMPALQMIFRASNKMVQKPGEYLEGKAHPTVFDGSQLDPVKMVTMAHEMKKECLPPLVQLKVVEEDRPQPGVDFFDVMPGENLLDTPCAIARIARSVKFARRMVVSAEGSVDPARQDLKFHWIILRGDPEKISIKKLNGAGSVAELQIKYHERRPVLPGSKLESDRVDIGVFVENSRYYSAPAFISVHYLGNEKRVYDAKGNIQSVDYADPVVSKNYVDPMLGLSKDWRDEYRYGKDGKMTGWIRVRKDKTEEFSPDGGLIVKKDAEGAPLEVKKVRYNARQGEGGKAAVEEQIIN